MAAQIKVSTVTPKPKMFRLEQLFGSKTRGRLLGVFLNNPEQAFFVRELTRKIDAQLNSVRREIQNLTDLGLVKEKFAKKGEEDDKKAKDNKKYFIANTDCILFHDLRSLMQKTQILLNKNLVQEIDSKGKVDFLALTGKFVQDSDLQIDLLIVGDISDKSLREIVKRFEQELGDEVNFTMMPREEYVYRKQISDRFLFSVLDAPKVVMIDRLSEIV